MNRQELSAELMAGGVYTGIIAALLGLASLHPSTSGTADGAFVMLTLTFVLWMAALATA